MHAGLYHKHTRMEMSLVAAHQLYQTEEAFATSIIHVIYLNQGQRCSETNINFRNIIQVYSLRNLAPFCVIRDPRFSHSQRALKNNRISHL